MARKGGRPRGRHSSRTRPVEQGSDTLTKAISQRALSAAGIKATSLVDAVQGMTHAALTDANVYAPVQNLPRDPLDTGPFGPLWPLLVQAINPPRKDTGRPEPRVWEYPTGFNLPGGGDRLIPWATLRSASVNVDIIRRCIEIRKDDVRALKWSWTISEDAIKAAQEADPTKPRDDIESELRKKYAPDIERLTKMWQRPWITNGVRFGQWVAAVMEDHITLDAVAIYPIVTVGGDVVGFRVVDGTTIKLLINDLGERPQPPYAAFQQITEGFPRGEYIADVVLNEDGTEDTSSQFTASQITYWRENFRTYTPYGFSQVEQALVSAALYLKRQGWMHAEYDEGSTPLTWLVPQGDKFTAQQIGPTQRREYETAINDDMEGQTGRRHRIKISYPGFQPEQMDSVDERYKPDYDLYLLKTVASHLGVTLDRLGFTESKGLGATGQHERQAEVQDDSGVNPDAAMLTDLIMELSRNYLDAPLELVFAFSKDKVEDEAAKNAIVDQQRKNGTINQNEGRKALGLQPLAMPEADMPSMVTATGIVYLEGGAEKQAQMDAAAVELAQNPPVPGAPGSGGGPGRPGPGGGGGTGGSKPKPTGTAKPAGPASAPRNKSPELRAFARWFKSLGGKPPARPFRFENCAPEDVSLAYEHDYVPMPLHGEFMSFDGYEWRQDITKDWRAWNSAHPLHPRGPHGRFVKVGNLVDELRRVQGEISEHHENALDEAVRRVQAGRPIRRGESQLADDLERRGLLEEYGGVGGNKNRLELSEAGRRHLAARWDDGGDTAPEPGPAPTDYPGDVGEGYGDYGPPEAAGDRPGAPGVANPEPYAATPEEAALHAARERFDDTLGKISAHERRRRADDERAAADPAFREERNAQAAEGLATLLGMGPPERWDADPPKVQAARKRQERVDRARAFAEQLADMEENLADQHDTAEVVARVRSAADRNPKHEHLGAFASIVEGHQGDREAMLRSARSWAAEHGLTAVGAPGERVTFDPAQHHAPPWMQREMRDGGMDQPMQIVRPGYRFNDPEGGEEIRLSKPAIDFLEEPAPVKAPEPPSGAAAHSDIDVSPEQRARELDAMQTREEAAAYLATIKGKELDALARQYSVQHHRTADARRRAIVEFSVGHRLNGEAIARGTSSYTDDARTDLMAPKPAPRNTDAELIGGVLAGMGSREEAAGYVDGLNLTGPQLKELARDLGVPFASKDAKAKVRDRIVQQMVGVRLTSHAIFPGTPPKKAHAPAPVHRPTAPEPVVHTPGSDVETPAQKRAAARAERLAARSRGGAQPIVRDLEEPKPAEPTTAQKVRQRTVDELAQAEAALASATDERKRERLEFARDQLAQQIADIDAQEIRRQAADRQRATDFGVFGKAESTPSSVDGGQVNDAPDIVEPMTEALDPSAPEVPPLGPGPYKSPEQIATDAAAYRVTAQGKIDGLKAEREQWIAEHGGAKPTGIAKDYFDGNIRKWELRRDGAEHEVTPFGQLGIVPATAEQQAIEAARAKADAAQAALDAAEAAFSDVPDESLSVDEHNAQIEAHRAHMAELHAAWTQAERELMDAQRPGQQREKAARDAEFSAAVALQQAELRAKEDEKARAAEWEKTNLARRQAEEADRKARVRAELIKRTPEGYGLLLGDGPKAIAHEPSRKVVQAMQAGGWQLVGQSGAKLDLESPEGREISVILGKRPFFTDDKGHSLTYPRALEYVSAHADAPKPPVPSADETRTPEQLLAAATKHDAMAAQWERNAANHSGDRTTAQPDVLRQRAQSNREEAARLRALAAQQPDAPKPPVPRTDTRPRFETYRGRKIKVRKNPREWGTLETSINGQVIGTPYGGRPEDLDKHVEQLKRDIDAMDERRLTDPTAYPEIYYRGAPTPPVPSADERQLETQRASYQALVDRADGLDSEINLAATDAERRTLERERDAVDAQMAALDRQIAAAHKRLKRKGRGRT